MSETRTVTIESVEKKEYNGKTFYEVMASGKKYACREDISQFKGQTGVAEVNSKQNGKYTNWYLNKFTPNQDSTPAANGSSKEDYFVLSYSKDLAVAAISSGQLDPLNIEKVSKYVIDIYILLSAGINDNSGVPF